MKHIFNSYLYFCSLLLFSACLFGKEEHPQKKRKLDNPGQGKVVLINGSPCSGKSTVAKALLDTAKQNGNNWELIDLDYLPEDDEISMAKRHMIIQFIEKNLGRTISEHQREKLLTASRETLLQENYGLTGTEFEQFEVKSFPQLFHLVFSKVIRLVREGKNVILPIVTRDLEALKRFDNIYFVLVHCPLDVLVQRVELRNQKASAGSTELEKDDARNSFEVLAEATSFYKAGNQGLDLILDQLSFDQANSILKQTKDDFASSSHCSVDDDFENWRKKLHSNFGLDSQDNPTIHLSPRKLYDVVINNSNSSLKECAKQILDCVQNTKPTALKRNF